MHSLATGPFSFQKQLLQGKNDCHMGLQRARFVFLRICLSWGQALVAHKLWQHVTPLLCQWQPLAPFHRKARGTGIMQSVSSRRRNQANFWLILHLLKISQPPWCNRHKGFLNDAFMVSRPTAALGKAHMYTSTAQKATGLSGPHQWEVECSQGLPSMGQREAPLSSLSPLPWDKEVWALQLLVPPGTVEGPQVFTPSADVRIQTRQIPFNANKKLMSCTGVQQHLPQQPTSEARIPAILPAALSDGCPWPHCLALTPHLHLCLTPSTPPCLPCMVLYGWHCLPL